MLERIALIASMALLAGGCATIPLEPGQNEVHTPKPLAEVVKTVHFQLQDCSGHWWHSAGVQIHSITNPDGSVTLEPKGPSVAPLPSSSRVDVTQDRNGTAITVEYSSADSIESVRFERGLAHAIGRWLSGDDNCTSREDRQFAANGR